MQCNQKSRLQNWFRHLHRGKSNEFFFSKMFGEREKFTEIKDKLSKRKLGGKSLVNFQKEKSQESIFRKKKKSLDRNPIKWRLSTLQWPPVWAFLWLAAVPTNVTLLSMLLSDWPINTRQCHHLKPCLITKSKSLGRLVVKWGLLYNSVQLFYQKSQKTWKMPRANKRTFFRYVVLMGPGWRQYVLHELKSGSHF